MCIKLVLYYHLTLVAYLDLAGLRYSIAGISAKEIAYFLNVRSLAELNKVPLKLG